MERRNVVSEIMGFAIVKTLSEYFEQDLQEPPTAEQAMQVRGLLSLACLAGMHMALVAPESVAGTLHGSQEVHGMVSESWRHVFEEGDLAPDQVEEFIHLAMESELSLPNMPLTTEEFTFFPN